MHCYLRAAMLTCKSLRALELNLPTSDQSDGSRPVHFQMHHHCFLCKLLLVKQVVESSVEIFDCMMPMIRLVVIDLS